MLFHVGAAQVNISIHTPLAGSDEAGAAVLVKADVISIHTPLAGSDSLLCGRYQYNKFQSTLPLRGATMPELLVRDGLCISIHTPLAGSDSPSASTAPIRQYFNPHSPCGERLRVCCAQSECRSISIHTPLAGSDRTMTPIRPLARLFQSTLPLRGATDERLAAYWLTYISIHTPLAGSDAIERGQQRIF